MHLRTFKNIRERKLRTSFYFLEENENLECLKASLDVYIFIVIKFSHQLFISMFLSSFDIHVLDIFPSLLHLCHLVTSLLHLVTSCYILLHLVTSLLHSFDRSVGVTLPDLPSRVKILNSHLKMISHSINERQMLHVAHHTDG